MLISIITVCKNDSDNLKYTIDSVLRQKGTKYEYLIWDGLSQDGTFEYIKKIESIRSYSRRDNGIFDAMNNALLLCRGKYIYYLNAGDIFVDDCVISKVSDYILNSIIEKDLYYGDLLYPNTKRYYVRQRNKISDSILFRGGICHQVWFMKKDIYMKLNSFNTEYKYSADIDFLIRAVKKHKIKTFYMNFPIAVYKGGGFSLSNMKRREIEITKLRKTHFNKIEYIINTIVLVVIKKVQKYDVYERIFRKIKG